MTQAPASATTDRLVPQAPDEEGNYVGYRKNVWRKSWLQNVIPWVMSFVMHVTLVVIAIVLLVAFREVLKTTEILEPASLSTATLGEKVGMEEASIGDPIDNNPASSLNPVESRNDYREQGAMTDASAALAAATSANGTVGSAGVGDFSASLTGGGGDGSPLFGDGKGGGGEGLFPTDGPGGGNVSRIVYVCDSSGSMSGEKQFLLSAELRAAIEKLEISQSYNVVFFSGDDFKSAFNGELKPASSRFRTESSDFIDVVPMKGQTNPIPALEAAFKMNPPPQLIFFLTDGDFNGVVSYEDVLSTVERLNASANPPVMVNTIQLITQTDEAESVLRKISSITGGEYSFAGRDDLTR